MSADAVHHGKASLELYEGCVPGRPIGLDGRRHETLRPAQTGRGNKPECVGANNQGKSSLLSPGNVLMNATIASLSASGADRPNWNSNMASTASRSVAALPSCR